MVSKTRFLVNLYNKDGDNYFSVYETYDYTIAREVCKAMDDLCCKDLIIDRESVYTESFDWAEVYDNEREEVAWQPRK